MAIYIIGITCTCSLNQEWYDLKHLSYNYSRLLHIFCNSAVHFILFSELSGQHNCAILLVCWGWIERSQLFNFYGNIWNVSIEGKTFVVEGFVNDQMIQFI